MDATKNEKIDPQEDVSLEDKYKNLFMTNYIAMPSNDEESLEQPSYYKVVQTVTTYGVYESI